MSTDCDTASSTHMLHNICLTCHTAWGCAVIILLRNMCYTVNGWHGVCIPSPPCYVTRNGHVTLAQVLRRPAPVHGQGRSNKTLGVRVGCRLRGRLDDHTSHFHLHNPTYPFPTLHLHIYAYCMPSTISSLLIWRSEASPHLHHSELFSKNTWHPLKMRV